MLVSASSCKVFVVNSHRKESTSMAKKKVAKKKTAKKKTAKKKASKGCCKM
jgi:hypothetical protein